MPDPSQPLVSILPRPPLLVKTHPEQLTSYIANINQVRGYHQEYCADITDRGFPCVISNDFLLDEPREYPFTSVESSLSRMEKRIITLRDPSLTFFIFFTEESQHNEIAAFELGLAIQTKATVVLVGPRPRNAIHTYREKSRIISCYDWDNFIQQRFAI